MHLFAGFISKEEGFPRENGGGPGAPDSGRQPWVAPAKEELLGEPVPSRPHPASVFHAHPPRETCPVATA